MFLMAREKKEKTNITVIQWLRTGTLEHNRPWFDALSVTINQSLVKEPSELYVHVQYWGIKLKKKSYHM